MFWGLIIMLAAGPTADEMSQLLPGELDGYRPRGKDGHFDRRTLFDLIDGGAEVYLALNFKRAVSRRYEHPDSPDIIADVFDMGSSPDAFGAYHVDMREGKDAGVGQESEYMGGSLAFWRGRFFVSVVTLKQTDRSKKAVLGLGKAIARAIGKPGDPPDLLKRLPEKGQIKSQVHYFHDWASLNRLFFLAEENLLGLGNKTEGILARYRDAVLVVIRYPHETSTRQARARVLADYLDDANPQGLARTENGKWSGFAVSGRLLIGVLDAPSEERTREIIREVKSHGQ